jgi:sodium pump decarboxylase gamma subunit
LEIIAQGLSVTVVGMGIVFGILILLYLVLMGMKMVFYKENEAVASTGVKEVKQEQVTAVQVEEQKEEIDEDELIAVLTAAVAASLNQSTYNLNIRSFRRIDQNAPVWNSVSRKEQLESRM